MNIPGPLTQLGRYQLNSVLGRGAMGLVYEATDPRLGRKVALKTILKSHLLDDAMAREYSARFVREAQAAARLNHPNIVTVFDFGEEDEVAYLVMEFIEGRELAQHFEDNHFFDLPGAVHILCELLSALSYAHDRGIVHRDIKPANVMIDQQGRVKLTDFGVARLADSNADRTLPGTMVGTPSYMSPEQIQGQAVGSRTDLFAAGVILYQFLTHQRPFTGGGQWTIQRKIVSEDPVPPSFANKAVPPVFDAIVQRALAKHPDQRYQTAAAFAADLRRALDTVVGDPDATVLIPPRPAAGAPASRFGALAVEPAPARRDGSATPTTATTAAVANASTLAPAPHPAAAAPPARPGVDRRAARSRWPWLAALGGVGALASALAWWQSGDAGPEGPVPGSRETSSPSTTPMPAPAPAPPVAVEPPPATATTPSEAPLQTPGVARAEPTPAPAPAKPAPTTPPRRAREAAPATPGTYEGPRPADGALAPAPRADSARCADLLQRLQLGEDLSPANLSVFQKECKR